MFNKRKYDLIVLRKKYFVFFENVSSLEIASKYSSLVYCWFIKQYFLLRKLLDKKLGTMRTALVIEGMEINHVHIKLYPLHGLNEKFKEMIAKENK
jgi:hypothetical protein